MQSEQDLSQIMLTCQLLNSYLDRSYRSDHETWLEINAYELMRFFIFINRLLN